MFSTRFVKNLLVHSSTIHVPDELIVLVFAYELFDINRVFIVVFLPSGRTLRMTTQEIVNEAVKAMSSVLEDKFSAFSRQFTEQNTSAIDTAVKKAKRETFTCKKKGNQQQYDHCQQVLEKFDESLDHFRARSTEKLKRLLEEGAVLVEKRIKATKLADKSNYGWATVREYLGDELPLELGKTEKG